MDNKSSADARFLTLIFFEDGLRISLLIIYFSPLDRIRTLRITMRKVTATPMPAIIDATGNPGMAPVGTSGPPVPRANVVDVAVLVIVVVPVLTVVPKYEVEVDKTVFVEVTCNVVVAFAVT